MPSPLPTDEPPTPPLKSSLASPGRERECQVSAESIPKQLESPPRDRDREGSWGNLEQFIAQGVEGVRADAVLSDAYGGGRRGSQTGAVSMTGSVFLSRRTSLVTAPVEVPPTTEKSKRSLGSLLLACSEWILQNQLFSILMWVLTVFALLGDDIRLVRFTSEDDKYFNIATIFSLSVFSIEIILSSLVKEDYFLGFWFLADLFATLSLIFDLTYVSEAMMGYPEISLENLSNNDQAGAVEGTEYARASRSARVGTRVARLLRVVRLVRVSRIMKCFQWFLQGLNLAKPQEDRSLSPGDGAEFAEAQAESRVGKRLSERTTQRLIILVLTMLVIIPQMNPGEYVGMMSSSAQYGANTIFQAWQDYELVARTNGTSAGDLLQKRRDWEKHILTYIYYHNWYTACPDDFQGDCAKEWLYKLCWMGYVAKGIADRPDDVIDVTQEGYIQAIAESGQDWDKLFTKNNLSMGDGMKYMVGGLPEEIKHALARPWKEDCSEAKSDVHGVSLLKGMPCPRSTLRKQETIWVTPMVHQKAIFDKYMEGQFVFVFDVRSHIEWEAVLGIVQTAFVVVVLAIGALLFSRDVDKLVLLPIERMISKVEIIRKNPLVAIRLGDLQYKDKGEKNNQLAANATPGKKSKGAKKQQLVKKQATMETKILENAIIKLGSLLALGFGEAGSEIIAHNLDDDNATVNAMIPGSKVDAVYGFCDIRNFSTTTEVLQEKTMVFVNQVAEIVHRIVDEHLGAANKNVGEAFLLVWRIGLYDHMLRPKIADLTVMSFIQVVAELNRNRQLAQYRGHPALLARFPNFRVSLGFGLHLGWSIEGAIGSEFKIDASYLSPHVNVASRLEAATEEYGVTILLSEPLVKSCTAPMSRYFRPVDHVKLQGSNVPTRLFTVDLNHQILAVESAISERRKKNPNRFQERQQREQLKREVLTERYQVHLLFDTDKDVRRMRERFTQEFFQEFEKGYLNYEAGEWDVAKQVLTRTRTMLASVRGADGPSSTLLDFMGRSNFEPPAGWPGWRELRER